MKTKVIMLMLTLAVSMVSGCCERRCGVKSQKEAEPINLQEKLIKMKQEAGGKGSK